MGNNQITIRKDKIFNRDFKLKILFVGLDAAGKTTILNNLEKENGVTVETITSFGLYFEEVEFRNTKIFSFDFDGSIPRSLLKLSRKEYFEQCNSIVFVIDSNDHERFEDVKEQIKYLDEQESLNGKPMVFFANKQDLPNAYTLEKISFKLELHNIKNRPYFIQITNGFTLEGVLDGFHWLSNTIKPII